MRKRQSFAHIKAGRREDLGNVRYRSKMEANVARYLKFLREHGDIRSWEYEPKTFWFERIRRGCTSYKPDFRIIEKDGREVWYEVKGYMDNKSRVKLRRMKIYFPEVKILVIDQEQYRSIMKYRNLITGWEN